MDVRTPDPVHTMVGMVRGSQLDLSQFAVWSSQSITLAKQFLMPLRIAFHSS